MSKINSQRNIPLPLNHPASGKMTIAPLWFISSIISQIMDVDPDITDAQLSYRICDALFRHLEANKFIITAKDGDLLFEDESVDA